MVAEKYTRLALSIIFFGSVNDSRTAVIIIHNSAMVWQSQKQKLDSNHTPSTVVVKVQNRVGTTMAEIQNNPAQWR